MLARIQKWGNSQGLRVPRQLLREAHIAVGDDVDLTLDEGQIVMRPASVTRGKYRLRDLLRKVPSSYHPGEEKWGAPVGKEAW